jgi:hypothetical protein
MDVLHFVLEESKRGNAVNMTDCFSTITMNNMTQMMFRKRFCSLGPSPEGPGKYTWLPAVMKEMFVVIGTLNLADYIPVLKPFDPQGLLKQAKVTMKKVDGFLEEIIAERRQMSSSAGSSGLAEDFTDALLSYSQENQYGETLSIDEVKASLFVSPRSTNHLLSLLFPVIPICFNLFLNLNLHGV